MTGQVYKWRDIPHFQYTDTVPGAGAREVHTDWCLLVPCLYKGFVVIAISYFTFVLLNLINNFIRLEISNCDQHFVGYTELKWHVLLMGYLCSDDNSNVCHQRRESLDAVLLEVYLSGGGISSLYNFVLSKPSKAR